MKMLMDEQRVVVDVIRIVLCVLFMMMLL